jgi:hypothetical protein
LKAAHGFGKSNAPEARRSSPYRIREPGRRFQVQPTTKTRKRASLWSNFIRIGPSLYWQIVSLGLIHCQKMALKKSFSHRRRLAWSAVAPAAACDRAQYRGRHKLISSIVALTRRRKNLARIDQIVRFKSQMFSQDNLRTDASINPSIAKKVIQTYRAPASRCTRACAETRGYPLP